MKAITKFFARALLGILILVSITHNGLAQRKKIAIDHIENLKEGILLVRLQTYQSKIKNLKEAGELEKARELEVLVKYRNRGLINAFKAEFDFCPAYFFLSHDVTKIKNRDFENVFIDENLNPIDVDTPIYNRPIYFASLGGTIIDTKFNPKYTKLFIMDSDLTQLKGPFPFYHGHYFTRTVRQGLDPKKNVEVRKRSTQEERMVYMLNFGLHKFYKKVQSKWK